MNMIVVGVFGILGALLRYGMGVWTNGWWHSSFPLGTLLINFAGCLALGWFSAWVAQRPAIPAAVRLGIGTGLVGAFTTFSTFSVETVALVQQQLIGFALLYVSSSLLGGLFFAWAGSVIVSLPAKRKGVRAS